MSNSAIDASNVRCFDASMLSTKIGDAIKGMELAQKEGEKLKEQKEKSLNVDLGVQEEVKTPKRLLDLRA